jgi:hypothetical protein
MDRLNISPDLFSVRPVFHSSYMLRSPATVSLDWQHWVGGQIVGRVWNAFNVPGTTFRGGCGVIYLKLLSSVMYLVVLQRQVAQ